jgi:alanyl-tRNA synthetase
VLPGAAAFKLYDTYGLALDEQEDMARERGLAIDRAGFEAEMEKQRARARASWKGAERAQVAPVYQELLAKGKPEFLRDRFEEHTCRVAGLVQEQKLVDAVPAGVEVEIVFDRTPFYAEAGGQVGDQGSLYLASGERAGTVLTTYNAVPGLTVHRVRTTAPVRTGDTLTGVVAAPLRRATMRNHTATHLLHASLRKVLGTHVKQAGSVVEPGRLRFDFTHYTAMDADELAEVERLMNEEILKNSPVTTEVMALDQAISPGAMALFGEKYGDVVRVVSVPGFSTELCGGTHVARTGDIGLAKIVYEGSISAGVRRIEAITGEGALARFQETAAAVHRAASLVRAAEAELLEHLEKMVEKERALERQVEQLKTKLAQTRAAELGGQAREVKGVKVLAAAVGEADRAQLRALVDDLRNKLRSGVVVLGSGADGEVAIVAGVTKDLAGRIHAGKLAGAVAAAVGGKGGGRPDMAEAGGKDAAKLPAALEAVYADVEKML